jgi:hypothetical protein
MDLSLLKKLNDFNLYERRFLTKLIHVFSKINNKLIRCLLDRSFKICSSEKQKDIEMEQL